MSKDSLLVIITWVVLSVINAILWYFTLNTDKDIFYSYYFSLFQFITPMIAAVLCFRTMKAFVEPNDLNRTAWGLLGLALLLWGSGAFIEGIYPFVINPGEDIPFPWYADIGYLLLIPFVILALFSFIKNLNLSIPSWGWSTTIVVCLTAFGFALWINTEAFKGLDIMTFMVTMLYIIFDSILLAMTLATASILMGGLLSRTWGFMLLGLFIFYLGDITYSYFRNSDQGYDAGGVILDLTWPLAFGLFALAATTARATYKDI